jgi:all-trans-retinol dehydrogenase (NAD+)
VKHLVSKRVLITGAGSGIGLALAERFAAEGAHVVLTDVDEARLEEAHGALRAAGRSAQSHRLDVTDEQSVLRARDEVHARGGPIDVLVNNAGVVFGGAFLAVPLERHLRTFAINTLGLVSVTHAFLPDLVARPEAHLVTIASASGLIGLPFGSTYAASKWAAIGFTESIRLELGRQGNAHVKVTTVCPSYVSTGLFEGARPPLTTSLLTPERLAAQIVEAVQRDSVFLRTPWLVQVTPILKSLLPTAWGDAVAAAFGATSSMERWTGRAEPPR